MLSNAPFSSKSDPLSETAQMLKTMRAQTQVCMFVDNSNLFHAIRGMGLKKLDYIRLRDFLADGRSADVRFYYSELQTDNDSNDKKAGRDRFYKFLEDKLSFNMIRLPLRERSGYDPASMAMVTHLRRHMSDDEILTLTNQRHFWLRQISGNENILEEKGLDCEIVYDISRLARTGYYSSFVLIAGDEDYARSVKKVREETGIPVELAFFGNGKCSTALQKAATSFIDLTNVPNMFTDYRSEEF